MCVWLGIITEFTVTNVRKSYSKIYDLKYQLNLLDQDFKYKLFPIINVLSITCSIIHYTSIQNIVKIMMKKDIVWKFLMFKVQKFPLQTKWGQLHRKYLPQKSPQKDIFISYHQSAVSYQWSYKHEPEVHSLRWGYILLKLTFEI